MERRQDTGEGRLPHEFVPPHVEEHEGSEGKFHHAWDGEQGDMCFLCGSPPPLCVCPEEYRH